MFDTLSKAMRGNQNARKTIKDSVIGAVTGGALAGGLTHVIAKGALKNAKTFKSEASSLIGANMPFKKDLRYARGAATKAKTGIALAQKEFNDTINPIFGVNRTKLKKASALYKKSNENLAKATERIKSNTDKINSNNAAKLIAGANARSALKIAKNLTKHSKLITIGGAAAGTVLNKEI